MRFETRELRRLFDYDPSTGTLTRKVPMGRYGPGSIAGADIGHCVATMVSGRWAVVSRIAWQITHGDYNEDLVIDHINGNPKDNRLCNLRLVEPADNSKNLKRRKDNSSGVMGVWFYKRDKKWAAEITANGIKYFLGYYDDFEQAVQARKDAEKRYGFHKNHGRVIQ